MIRPLYLLTVGLLLAATIPAITACGSTPDSGEASSAGAVVGAPAAPAAPAAKVVDGGYASDARSDAGPAKPVIRAGTYTNGRGVSLNFAGEGCAGNQLNDSNGVVLFYSPDGLLEPNQLRSRDGDVCGTYTISPSTGKSGSVELSWDLEDADAGTMPTGLTAEDIEACRGFAGQYDPEGPPRMACAL